MLMKFEVIIKLFTFLASSSLLRVWMQKQGVGNAILCAKIN